jgi:hypothetical protein
MGNSILAKMAVLISGDTSGLNKGIKASTKELNAFEKTAKSVGTTIKSAIGTIGFGLIAKEIIDVTANFQKLEAVLTNTLGSQSAAQIALRDIEEFAKRTPFSVDELSASFVKLANQGFKPTTDELRKLGDLASSTGKGFDQLAEAIIDAQTGEFERLKEFGIRAKKEGDNVRFTFKGVETQVKFTSDSIRDYILTLGDAEGVSGAMAAISGTLGGQISNLGDTWTQFLKTIGDGNNGILSGAVAILNDIIQATTKLIRTNRQLQEEIKVDAQSSIVTELKELIEITDDVAASSEKLTSRIHEEKEAIQDEIRAFQPRKNILGFILEQDEDHLFMLNAKVAAYDGQLQAINEHVKGLIQQATKESEAAAAAEVSLGLIQQTEVELKQLEIDKKKAFSVAEISTFNAKIDELQKKLSILNATSELSSFGKQQLADAQKRAQGETPSTPPPLEFKLGEDDPRDLNNIFPTEVPVPDIAPAMEAVKTYTQALIDSRDAGTKSAEELILANEQIVASEERKAAIAEQVGGIFGDTVGQVLSGQQSLVQGIKSATAKLLPILLAQALAGTIAGAGKTTAPPPAIIAMAAAGVAAIAALFRTATGHSGGGRAGGGGMSTNVSRVSPAPAQAAAPQDLTFTLHGNDLVAATTSEMNQRLRLGR